MADFSWNKGLCDRTLPVWVDQYGSVQKVKELLSRGSDSKKQMLRPYEGTLGALMMLRFKPSSEFFDKYNFYYKWEFQSDKYVIAEGTNTQGELVGVQDASNFCSNGTQAVLSLRKCGSGSSDRWGELISVRKSRFNPDEDALGVFAERQFHYGSIIGFVSGEVSHYDGCHTMDVQMTNAVSGEDIYFRGPDGRCVHVTNKLRVKWNDAFPLYLGMHYIQVSKGKKRDSNVELLTDGTVRVIKRIKSGEELILHDQLVCPLDTSNWSGTSSVPSALAECKDRCMKLLTEAESSTPNVPTNNGSVTRNGSLFRDIQGGLSGYDRLYGMHASSAREASTIPVGMAGSGLINQASSFGSGASSGSGGDGMITLNSVGAYTNAMPHNLRNMFLTVLDSFPTADRLQIAHLVYNNYMNRGYGALMELMPPRIHYYR